MTDLVVRRLLIDLETPFAARWNGGDAFRSPFSNALSLSLPLGPHYSIDPVRAGIKALRRRWRGDTLGFHDTLLSYGHMPLAWIAEEMQRAGHLN